MDKRVDLPLVFKGIHGKGKSFMFDNDGSLCYLSKREIALRDIRNGQQVRNLSPGDTVLVNMPIWLALKAGLMREELS